MHGRIRFWSCIVVGAILSGGIAGGAAPAPAPQTEFLQRYCLSCHNDRLKSGGLTLAGVDPSAIGENTALWEKIVRKLQAQAMPPPGVPRPDGATTTAFVAGAVRELDRLAAERLNPGRTEAMHRLSRTEYQNAIRDLLELDLDMSDLLPPDDQSYGFDNIAGVLGLSPALLDRYIGAAQKISRLAMTAPPRSPVAETFRVRSDQAQDEEIEGAPFGTRGGTLVRYTFPVDAEYRIAFDTSASSDRVFAFDGTTHQLVVLIDGLRVGDFTVGRRRASDGPLEVRVPVTAGTHTVIVTFVRKTSAEVETLRQPFERPYGGLAPRVDAVTVTGPYSISKAAQEPPSRRRILVCRPDGPSKEPSCAASIARTLARRAFRRTVTETDMNALLAAYNDGRTRGDFDAGVEAMLRRVLASPDFLFRIERDPLSVPAGSVYRISGLELASRLSFFLWSSPPDDDLLDAAERGTLHQPAVLERQVRRMLADSRSTTLVTSFAAQWLKLRKLDAAVPNEFLFPNFDDTLRTALRRETELFFENLIREDRSVLDLLASDYTFVNERLARHYGITNVYGNRFRRVSLPPGGPRGGLLGQGSILLVTSYATRTSPVQRGKWILENLLGMPPAPPPPNVPELKEKTDSGRVLSGRERMAQHRANPVCASCHQLMDPLGLALENFDATGSWRARDESGQPIDASGSLPGSGATFSGPFELREVLRARSDLFLLAMTEKLLTYALGRGVEPFDASAVRRIVRDARADDYRFSSLVLGIARSVPFQMRKAWTPPSAVAAARP